MKRALATAAAIALAACGGGKAGPSEPASNQVPPAIDAGVDAGPDVALLTEIADGMVEILATMVTITTAAPDCATMAAQLGRLFDQAAPLFDLAEAQASDPAARSLLISAMEARADEVRGLADRISAGLVPCRTDPGVEAAMERMPTFEDH